MTGSLGDAALFALLPVVATIVGGVLATLRPPGPRLRSGRQHVAAGLVAAAVAGELLPEMREAGEPLVVSLGFALGVGSMLAVRQAAAPAAGGPRGRGARGHDRG